jgi:hypothetical protein
MAVDDSYTISLLHMNGTDASTTFTDESGKAWTANGDSQIDTAQSVFGGASGLFDGTGDYLSASDSADWRLDEGSDSNEWTIDFRVRFNGDPGTGGRGFVQQYVDVSNYWLLYINNNSLDFIVRSGGSNIVVIQNSWNPATTTWYHIAVVKQGTTGYKMFVDGTQIGTTQTDTSPIPDLAGVVYMGRIVTSAGTAVYHNGWFDEFRISKGIARWTSDFTPPTSEYAPITSNFFTFF